MKKGRGKAYGGEGGAILVVVLVVVVVTGIMATVAGTSWKTVMQRAREEELLWRGGQYRSAIGAYYRGSQGDSQAQYPENLEALLKDPRSLKPVRYIRKLYTDPITGEPWVPVKGNNGRILGVRSSSSLPPFKTGGFPEENKGFDKASKYSDWLFIHDPK